MNERFARHGSGRFGRSRPDRHGGQSRAPERTIRTETIKVERKTFVLALMENERGPFLRITEEATRRRARIIIPLAGMNEFRHTLETLREMAEGLPAPEIPPGDSSPAP